MFKVFQKKKVETDTFVKLQEGENKIYLVTCDADGDAINDVAFIDKKTGEVVLIRGNLGKSP